MTTTDWPAVNKAVWPEIQITPQRWHDDRTGFTLTSKLDGQPYPFGMTLIGDTGNWEDLNPAYAAAGINAMAEYAVEHGDNA